MTLTDKAASFARTETEEGTVGEELKQLISRIDASEEADQDLDADLAVALGHEVSWRTANGTMEHYPVIHWKAPHPYAGMKEPCPRFTGSTDAAMRLVATMLPGWDLDLNINALGRFGKGFAELRGPNLSDHNRSEFFDNGGHVQTPALAIVGALARAITALGNPPVAR